MTYALSAPLQTAIFGALQGSTALTNLVGAHIFDAPPTGTLPELYVSLGPETVRDAGDAVGAGAWHEIEISVVTETAGFQSAKIVAGLISDTLQDADLTLSRGRLVGLWFEKAKASREDTGGIRRIDLTFRARLEDTQP